VFQYFQYSITYSGSKKLRGLPKQIIAGDRAGALRVLARVSDTTRHIPVSVTVTRIGRQTTRPGVISKY